MDKVKSSQYLIRFLERITKKRTKNKAKTMNEAQTHYTTTEKELLAVVHIQSIKEVSLPRRDAKARPHAVDLVAPRLMIMKFRDKKGAENLAANHLSQIKKIRTDKLENQKKSMKHFLKLLDLMLP
ncbi:hypothetical protein Tco_0795792 [Tanacetum coccineum]